MTRRVGFSFAGWRSVRSDLVRYGLIAIGLLLYGTLACAPVHAFPALATPILVTPALATPILPSSVKRVLLLNSYNYTYNWSRAINHAVVETLEREAPEVLLSVEFMDSKNFSTPADLERFHKYLRGKYQDTDFDMVIASDDQAVDFVLQHREDLFPGAPIVFCGVNDYTLPERADFKNITGVLEVTDPDATLRAALHMHPHVGKVYVINDATLTGLKNEQSLIHVLPDFQDRVSFEWLGDTDLLTLLGQLRELPPDSIVLLLTYNKDGGGSVLTHSEAIQHIRAASPRPVYSMWDFYLGYGIVGGRLMSGKTQGEEAARIALRVLRGVPPEDIPVEGKNTNRFRFDYNELQRFGIDMKRLPTGSTVINEPETLLESYWVELVLTMALIVSMVAVIVALLINVVSRKRAEQELEAFAQSLEVLVEERTQELAQRSQELEDANYKLHQLDKAKTAVVNTVAHDLRAPLTTVLGFCKLAARDFQKFFMPLADGDESLNRTGTRIFDNLGIVNEEGGRLTRLINDLLDLARIESGRMIWNDELIDLSVLINQAVPTLEGYFQDKDVVFRQSIAAGLPKVCVDVDRIMQVVTNLVGNAAKFTTRGHVELVVALSSGGKVRISVADTGPGIATSDIDRIFDSFCQAANSNPPAVTGGSGMGLAICKTIVGHYGGEIWAESTPGNGAVLHFTLPFVL